MIKRSIFSLLLCAVAALDLFALPHKAVYVPELSGAVKFDGKTDETVWQQAVLLQVRNYLKSIGDIPCVMLAYRLQQAK